MNKKQVPFQPENLVTYEPHGDWIASVDFRVGHSDEAEGAENQAHDLTEYDYNSVVAHNAAKLLQQLGVMVDVYQRDLWGEYSDMTNVLSDRHHNVVDGYEADIELHLNSYNGKAHGTEILHHHKSKRGALLARCLIGPVVANFDTSKHRGGVVPLSPGERAYNLVNDTPPPVNIVEAGYIDNLKDEAKLIKYWSSYDEALTDGLVTYLKAIGIVDPRLDSWEWVPKQNLSDDLEIDSNGIHSTTCPVCNRIDCDNYRDYRENSTCKNW